MASLERGLVGQDNRLSRPVALTCCDNLVADLLLLDLAGFCQSCPGIELRFTTDSRPDASPAPQSDGQR